MTIMASGLASLQCIYRRALHKLSPKPPSRLHQLTSPRHTELRFISTDSSRRAAAVPSAESTSNSGSEEPLLWSQTKERTRLVPVSPSYFTGNSDFFDNWLALQELERRYQTLPTVPKDQAPHIKWKTLAEYRGIIGRDVRAAKYKKIINILDRLSIIDLTMVPREVNIALDMYKRNIDHGQSQAKPKVLDGLGRAYGVGRRKTSVAKVWVLEGDGQVLVNGKPLAEVFERVHDRESAIWPLIATRRMDKYNVWATVGGGGKTGQAEALTLGVGRALLVHEPALKPALRRG
jgi:small subunit ribosomal protein S9